MAGIKLTSKNSKGGKPAPDSKKGDLEQEIDQKEV